MPCYRDFDGVYFSLLSLQIHHKDAMDEVELLVIDGCPDSEEGKATAHFCKNAKIRYIPAPQAYGTAQTKQLVFDYAETPYVMCMDCHVLLDLGSVSKLLAMLGKDDGNLLQGPMVYDDGQSISTHLEPVWRGGMEGIWATDERGKNPNYCRFEIPAQGMGLFACHKEAWPGFNPLFRGFGGEEYYIHRKFQKRGKKVYCLPFLRWHHRFGRPGGQPYPNILEDRIFNYVIGHLEMGLDPQPIRDHFVTILDSKIVDEVGANALEAFQGCQVQLEEACETR